jgi:hypothetical protein
MWLLGIEVTAMRREDEGQSLSGAYSRLKPRGRPLSDALPSLIGDQRMQTLRTLIVTSSTDPVLALGDRVMEALDRLW